MAGGPTYQTPYPVKRSDGSSIIWNWDTQTWDPYDEAKGAAAKADAARTRATTASGGVPGGPGGPGDMGQTPGTNTSPSDRGSATEYQVPKTIPQSMPAQRPTAAVPAPPAPVRRTYASPQGQTLLSPREQQLAYYRQTYERGH